MAVEVQHTLRDIWQDLRIALPDYSHVLSEQRWSRMDC